MRSLNDFIVIESNEFSIVELILGYMYVTILHQN